MSKPSRQPSDFDNPWKETLERFFPEFLAFFFPHAHADVDLAKGYEFLDKELKRVTREAAMGERRVDALVKIWHKNGVETWVLVHIEVQSQEEAVFAERMYVYNYRLFDRFHKRVASLAILGDERVSWRPDRFEYALWGCRVSLEFPIVKLVDYRERWAELEFRFGTVPDAVERMLQQLDLVRLEDAIDFALSSDSLETFCEATGLQPT